VSAASSHHNDKGGGRGRCQGVSSITQLLQEGAPAKQQVVTGTHPSVNAIEHRQTALLCWDEAAHLPHMIMILILFMHFVVVLK
jgi:hypothetical protein